MSEYIDADALIRRWCGMKCGCERDECGREIEPCIVVMTIEEAPSIDIVRCKECVKANTEDCSHAYWDDDWGEWRIGYKGDDWFCADGERKGE